MIDILDLFHYLIGMIIVGVLIWVLIQIHNHFSKNNTPLDELINEYKQLKGL